MGRELVAVYPDIHHICFGGVFMCQSGKLALIFYVDRKKLDILDIIRASDYIALAVLCVTHQHPAWSVCFF